MPELHGIEKLWELRSDLIIWLDKCDNCENYLNGDSDVFPNENGFDEIRRICNEAKKVHR